MNAFQHASSRARHSRELLRAISNSTVPPQSKVLNKIRHWPLPGHHHRGERQFAPRRGRLRFLSFLLFSLFGSLLPARTAIAEGLSIPEPHIINIADAPWSAIGRVHNSVGDFCTGVLLSPRIAVTAAHCIYNQHSKRWVKPESIHFLLGYQRGDYGFHTTAAAYHIGYGYDPEQPIATLASDWVILELQEAAPATYKPMAIFDGPVAVGMEAISVGFARERAHLLTAIKPCMTRIIHQSGMIAGACESAKGYSGGPLYGEKVGALIGIQVAVGRAGREPVVYVIVPSRWTATFLRILIAQEKS